MDSPQYPTNEKLPIVGVIYLITNLVNGKKYVGQTVQTIRRRWYRHLSDALRGKDTALARAICKYGQDSFAVEIIDTANTLHKLNELEEHYISMFGTLTPAGYNLLPGGDNHTLPVETRLKIGKAHRGKIVGAETRLKMSEAAKKQTAETRSKISEAMRGRIFSAETRRKISEAKKGWNPGTEMRQKIGEANKKRIISSKTRLKMSEAQRERWRRRREQG